MVYLTRKLEFSASHLYHNPALSAEENRRVFGKCNNPHGHGHNYTLEVTIAGEPDPVTGMVLDLKELKEILDREITQRMDHRFLNYEVLELKNQIPTCENIACVCTNRPICLLIATATARREPPNERNSAHRARTTLSLRGFAPLAQRAAF